MEGSGDLWVQLDRIAALLYDFTVPSLDLVTDPLGEEDLQDRRADITNPLLRSLVDLLLLRQVVEDLLVASFKELADLLDGEALILRHRDVPDILVLDDFEKKVKMRKRLSLSPTTCQLAGRRGPMGRQHTVSGIDF